MRITSKGQVTIPIHIREQAGLLPHTEVEFLYENGEVKLSPSRSPRKSRGALVVEHLRGRGNKRMTTDEIMAMMRGHE